MNCIIIGAGQLGSRHLQGMLKVETQLNIFVVDPSENSLSIAKERACEIEHSHNITYLKNIDNLTNNIDIAIISTSSNIRFKITSDILQKIKIKYLILEKVLFQTLDEYSKFEKLINNYDTKVWVNHPRRMFPHYKELKALVSKNSSKIHYTVNGSSWGLACNGLHFIDLFCFVSNSRLKSIELKWLENKIIQSKREGFVEFTGSIIGELENGDTFIITEFDGVPSPMTLGLFSDEYKCLIQEGGTPQIITIEKENKYNINTRNISIYFQSELTSIVIDELIKTNNCSLPTYNEAQHSHLIFINDFLTFYNNLNSTLSLNLPIT